MRRFKSADLKGKNAVHVKLMSLVFLLLTLALFLCGFLGVNVALGEGSSVIDKRGNIKMPSSLTASLAKYSKGEIQTQDELEKFKIEFQNFLYQCVNADKGNDLIDVVRVELQKIGASPISSYVRRSSQIRTLEKYMAQEAHQEVLKENGGEWNTDFNKARANRILSIILNNIGEDSKNFTLTLLNTRTINAFSTADGNLYLTRGLMNSSTDDDIAFVIAHELYHILSGHWVNWWSEDRLFSWSGIDEAYYPGVAELVSLGVESLSGQATTSYGQEFEADAFAIYVAAKCGYNVDNVKDVMSSLPDMPVSSHPSVDARIENIEEVYSMMKAWEMVVKFNPVKVAIAEIRDILLNGVDQHDAAGVIGMNQGFESIETGFNLLFKNVKLISDKGGRVIGDIGEMEDAINDRLVGRVMMLSPDICVVEVGLDTSLGRSTAGTVGEKLGRIWLMKVNGSWESVAVHRELGPISQYRDGFEDELQNAAYEKKDIIRNEVLDTLRIWRDTFCSNFKIHIDSYTDSWRTEADEIDDFDDVEVADGSFEAMVWSWFMNKTPRSSMPVQDLQCTIFSPNTVVVRFTFTFKVGSLSIYSGNARLIVARSRVSDDPERPYDEYEPDWKVAEVILS